ncbi:MAG: OB-fold nucleic acid binding domain-containing protein, partial [Anaerolineaceae bacterium]
MDELMAQRLSKLDALRAAGMDPFPPRAARSHTAAEITLVVEGMSEDALEATGELVDIVGRVVGRRDMGKATFIDLQDGSGRIQVLLRQNA